MPPTSLLAGDPGARLNEESNRLLVENAPLGIHQIDMQGNLTSMNPAGIEMVGASNEKSVIGLPYLRVVGDGDRDRIGALLKAALKGKAAKFEFTAVNDRLHSSSFIPIRNKKGKVIRLLGIADDIDELRKMEEGLRLFRPLVYHSNDANFFIDGETGCFSDVNLKAVESLGYTLEELRGMKASDIEAVLPDDFSWQACVETVRKTGHMLVLRSATQLSASTRSCFT